MGDTTGIGWTDRTWNCWQGCTKKSAACQNCYMFRDKLRYGQEPGVVVRSKPPTFNKPLSRWGAGSTKGTPGAYKWPDGDRVFTCSWSDWFHEAADAWRDDAWAVVRARPGLIFQILTKRPENIAGRLPADWGPNGYSNVWMGVTVENQRYMDERVPLLTGTPAALRFVSYEPALGPVRVPFGIDWFIAGGESGPKARRSAADWFRRVRDECVQRGIPFYFKQWGEYDQFGTLLGALKAGKVLDARMWCEFPGTGERAA